MYRKKSLNLFFYFQYQKKKLKNNFLNKKFAKKIENFVKKISKKKFWKTNFEEYFGNKVLRKKIWRKFQ